MKNFSSSNTIGTMNNNSNSLMKALGWAYDKAVDGFAGLDSAQKLASDYLRGEGSVEKKIDSLVKHQCMKSFGTGFITGLGGLVTLPVTIPADLASSFVIQSRMIAAIAVMRGYDIHDDRVRTLCYLCIACDSAQDVARQVGKDALRRLLIKGVERIPKTALAAINRKVGIKLVTKFSNKGVIQLGKLVPFVGGIINGGVETVSTRIVAKVARGTFVAMPQEVCCPV